MSVQVMKELLKTLPKRNGLGDDRKLDLLETNHKIVSQLHDRINACLKCPERNDIDKLLWDCCLDALRLLIVSSNGKLSYIHSQVLDLLKAQSEIQRERFSR